MKKIVMGVLTCFLLVTPIFVKADILSINGKDVSIDVQQINGRTLIPLRKLADELGLITDFQAKSYLYGKNNCITISTPSYSKSVVMFVESKLMYKDYKQYSMDVAPTTINNITYIPLRVICEEFGFNIDIVNGKVNVVSSNTSSNVYNQQVENNTLRQSDYICDSDLLKPFVDGSGKMAEELLKQKGYGYSVYLEAATKQNEWAELLSAQTVFTPEGKILKEALINEMKVVGKGYHNLYKGKNINYDELLNVEHKVYEAVKSFRIALQKMGL